MSKQWVNNNNSRNIKFDLCAMFIYKVSVYFYLVLFLCMLDFVFQSASIIVKLWSDSIYVLTWSGLKVTLSSFV